MSQRRISHSPSPLIYARSTCSCVPGHPSRTAMVISSRPGNVGKLSYKCEVCDKFAGWCNPVVPDTDGAIPEYHPNPSFAPLSPCTYTYGLGVCKDRSCRKPADIYLSGTVANRGKLFYSCTSCRLFAGWCLPKEMMDSSSGMPSRSLETSATSPLPTSPLLSTDAENAVPLTPAVSTIRADLEKIRELLIIIAVMLGMLVAMTLIG